MRCAAHCVMRCEAAPVCSVRFRGFLTKATQQRARCAREGPSPLAEPLSGPRGSSLRPCAGRSKGSFLGVGHDGPHLAALVDFMEVAGWIEPDPGADPIGRGEVGMPVRRITGRGAEVLREDMG